MWLRVHLFNAFDSLPAMSILSFPILYNSPMQFPIYPNTLAQYRTVLPTHISKCCTHSYFSPFSRRAHAFFFELGFFSHFFPLLCSYFSHSSYYILFFWMYIFVVVVSSIYSTSTTYRSANWFSEKMRPLRMFITILFLLQGWHCNSRWLRCSRRK